MAYARTGKDSDVYVYGTRIHGIDTWKVHVVGGRRGVRAKNHKYVGHTFTCWSIYETIKLLHSIKDSGLLVPDRAFLRLNSEKYKTESQYEEQD